MGNIIPVRQPFKIFKLEVILPDTEFEIFEFPLNCSLAYSQLVRDLLLSHRAAAAFAVCICTVHTGRENKLSRPAWPVQLRMAHHFAHKKRPHTTRCSYTALLPDWFINYL